MAILLLGETSPSTMFAPKNKVFLIVAVVSSNKDDVFEFEEGLGVVVQSEEELLKKEEEEVSTPSVPAAAALCMVLRESSELQVA